jgi:hypothetical protein
MQWNKTYGGTGNDYAMHVVQSGDGGYALLGYTNSSGAGNNDAWIVRTDSNGNVLWNKTYGGTGVDLSYAMVQTKDGGYALNGYTVSGGLVSAYLVRTDSSGNMLWSKTYRDTNSTQFGLHMMLAADDGFAIVGTAYLNVQDLLLIKTDSAGNQQFYKTYGGPGVDSGYAILQTSDGGYLLTGNTASFSAGVGSDVWLIKTDANGVLPADPTAPAASAFSSVTVLRGWTWYFFAHSSGGVAPFTYQWYEGTVPIAGQTSMVLSVTKATAGTYTFFCKVTDAQGRTVSSNTITMTVIG